MISWSVPVDLYIFFRTVQKTATAVAVCKRGQGLIKVNGQPLHLLEPEILRAKVYEPVLLLGKEKFANVDIRVRTRGGGHTSQIYGEFFEGKKLSFGYSLPRFV